MKITVIGTGYVGLVAGTCLAELGNDVICLDVDDKKIADLNQDIIPIYEPGLEEMVKRNRKQGRLSFTTDKEKAIRSSTVIFIAVGTPMGENHEADLRYVKMVARDIGRFMHDYKVVVDKSTVPVGTAEMVKRIIRDNQQQSVDFDVVSNPEFLREGSAIQDFMVPDRIVIGADSEKAKDIMNSIYRSSLARTDHPLLNCDVKSAEMIKYASNSMLATRISFMNELSHLCERVGADIRMVAKGMGLDTRIGPRFLQAGVGYGGSCFPKDVQALIQTMRSNNVKARILDAVEAVNFDQKHSLLPKIKRLVPDLKGKTVAVWGLAFKPKTDDMREAPSIVVIKQLLEQGAKVRAFDPVAQDNAKLFFPNIVYTDNPLDTIKDAHALVICTEWDAFRSLDRGKMKELMITPNIVDGRNIYDPDELKAQGFNYIGVGRNGTLSS